MNAIVPAAERRRLGLGLSSMILANASTPQPRRISIKDNKFTLVSEDGTRTLVPTHHVDVVVVAVNPAKVNQYYADAYVPGDDEGFKPPACFSWDGKAPDPQSSTPQASSCAGCPQADWGSRINPQTGAKRRACDQAYSLAVIPQVEGVVITDLYRFLVKGGSFKPLTNYVKELAQHQHPAGRPVDMSDVVTRLTISQGVLAFQAVAFLNDATLAVVDKAIDSGEADVITGAAPQMAALAPPAPMQPLAPPQAPPAPPAFLAPPPAAETAEAAEKRKRRSKAEMEAARAAAAAPQAPFAPAAQLAPVEDIPAFLKRPEAPPTTGFGMGPGVAPQPELSAALSKAFSLPTQR